MAAPVGHACFQSVRPLKLSSRVHGSTHSCFMSGSALNTVHQQPAGTNAVRQTTMMSRYRGPRLRIVRRLGDLPGLTRKTPERKTPPGQHGATAKKPSQYGVRLMEKQKLRFNYGVTEHQLINYVKKARKMQGSTGENLLQLLEMRLDSIVFRLGMAPTMNAARQAVSHGHITVNGRRVDIPSYYCRPGEKISAHPSKQSKALVTTFYEQAGGLTPNHLSMNKENLEATVSSVVSRQDVGLTVNELLIVEYYSRKV